MWSWSCMETIPKENRISPLPFIFILLYSLPLLLFTLPQENGGQIFLASFILTIQLQERESLYIHWDKAEVSVREGKKKKKKRENKIAQQQPQQCFNQRIEKEYKRWSKWNLEDLLFHHKPSPIFIETLHFPFLFSFSHLFNLLVCFPYLSKLYWLASMPPLTSFFTLHLHYIPHC